MKDVYYATAPSDIRAYRTISITNRRFILARPSELLLDMLLRFAIRPLKMRPGFKIEATFTALH